MALITRVIAVLAQCSWILCLNSTKEFKDDETFSKEILKGRCLSRCFEKYGKTPIKSMQDTLYRVYQANDCFTNECKKCVIPCGNITNKTEHTCKEICMPHGNICLTSCHNIFAETLNVSGNLNNSVEVADLKMICQHVSKKNSVTVFLGWDVKFTNETAVVFVISMIHGTNSSNWKTLGQIKRSVVPVHGLAFDSDYLFKVTVVTVDGAVLPSSISGWVRTINATDDVVTPKDVHIDGQKVHNGLISALLKWNPGIVPPCYYTLYWMTSNPQHPDYYRDELTAPPVSMYWINNLHFGSNYTLHMSSSYYNRGSPEKVTWFITADCLAATNYNYSLCAPDKPLNVTGDVVLDPENTSSCLVNISWSPPLHTDSNNGILYYLIKWYKIIPIHMSKYMTPHQESVEVSRHINYFEIKDLHSDHNYTISVQAVSSKGPSKPVILVVSHDGCKRPYALKSEVRITGNTELNLIIGGTTGILLITTILLLGIFLRIKLQKKNTRAGRTEELNPLYCHGTDYATHLVPAESYEIEFSSLTLLDVLGEGAFGKVYKAKLNDPKICQEKDFVVAVKMLKDLHDVHEKKSLLMEIDFMKQLGSHPHIVSFIACCKKEMVCLLMDYCKLGDLRSFLLRYRQRQQKDYRSLRLSSDDDSGLNSSAGSTNIVNTTTELHQTRLLSYARQIVLAMEYMASKKLIHRDLAARNILMCDEERLKISDFGLTRDIYERNLYQPTSARRLPYKWMALEAIFDQVFTIKSDIWSFGIVLWEIVTLGGSPYPGIPNKDLFNLLKEGYRMEKPENCSLEVYQLMLSVWHPNPYCRPSFTELRKKLEEMLEETKPYINLSVSISNDYYDSSSCSDHSDRGSLPHNDQTTTYVEMSTKDSILTYETPFH